MSIHQNRIYIFLRDALVIILYLNMDEMEKYQCLMEYVLSKFELLYLHVHILHTICAREDKSISKC